MWQVCTSRYPSVLGPASVCNFYTVPNRWEAVVHMRPHCQRTSCCSKHPLITAQDITLSKVSMHSSSVSLYHLPDSIRNASCFYTATFWGHYHIACFITVNLIWLARGYFVKRRSTAGCHIFFQLKPFFIIPHERGLILANFQNIS